MAAIDVHSREDFVQFVRELSRATENSDTTSDNVELPHYLEAVSAWTNDMPGYFANDKKPVPEPSWELFAMILEAALTYE